jgi:Tfp pilus assembly protein PilO
MSSFVAKLNLRPQERRFVVIVGIIVFVVVNVWFVWPHFADWQRTRTAMEADREKLETYQNKIAMNEGKTGYAARLAELSDGARIEVDEREIELLRTVQNQAVKSRMGVTRYDPISRANALRSSEFFEEQSLRITVKTGEKELVNFLTAISEGNSMIRVRNLDVRPDNQRYQLEGSVVLVASYQKSAGRAVPSTRRTRAAPQQTSANPRRQP